MVDEVVFLVERDHEGGYLARAVGASIVTEGENLETLRRATHDAVRCHFEPSDVPATIRLHVP